MHASERSPAPHHMTTARRKDPVTDINCAIDDCITALIQIEQMAVSGNPAAELMADYARIALQAYDRAVDDAMDDDAIPK